MNYETMSDFEVNEKLYNLLGLTPSDMDISAKGMFEHLRSISPEMKLAMPNDDSCYGKDYCNSWSDAGPLIEEHFDYLMGDDEFGVSRWNQCTGVYGGINPKRAAAICIIMKLEDENE